MTHEVAPNILLAPNMTQNAERKHRTQDANTAHNWLPHPVDLQDLLTPANEVCEGYVFTNVCLSTGVFVCPLHAGIHPPGQVHPLGRYTPGRYTPPTGTPSRYTPLGHVHPLPSACWDTHPHAQCMLGCTPLSPALHSACWDMVNKRAVRIPLECILVDFMVFCKIKKSHKNPAESINPVT